MRLNAHDLLGLRRLADDAQRDGKFEDAETLNELLDSREDLEEVFNQDPKVQDVAEVVDIVKGRKETQEAIDTLGNALELVADDLDSEAGNFDDVQISIAAEVDRLKEIALSPTKDAVAELLKVGEAVVNLADVVSTLRGQRNRLNDSAKRAREALRETGR